jgi:hypothetical protein
MKPFFGFMKNELINLWLNGDRNYKLGVEIYNRFGDNDFLKGILAEGEDDYNRERLIEELKELLKTNDIIASEPTPKPQRIDYEDVKASELPNAPSEVKEARAERKQLYFEARDAHSQLKALRSLSGDEMKEKRKQLAKSILQNFDLIKPLWDFTNFYDEFQRMPEPKQEEEETQSNYALMDNMQLNELWLKQYKYCQKWKADKTKINQLKERVKSNKEIQNVLGDAFQYRKYQMPIIADTE